jgi:hypothetical protein
MTERIKRHWNRPWEKENQKYRKRDEEEGKLMADRAKGKEREDQERQSRKEELRQLERMPHNMPDKEIDQRYPKQCISSQGLVGTGECLCG